MQTGRLELTTPEGIRLHLTPAGPVARAWAWLIDFALFWVTMLMLIFIFSLAGKTGRGMLAVVGFILYWGYPVLCEVYFHGQTIGKRALKIQVVRQDGLPVGWRESVLRNLLLVADFLPFVYVSGLLCMLFDPCFRRIGDLVAGTQVIYVETLPARTVVSKANPVALPWPLTPEQQRALADLFEREPNLPASRLAELGSIAEPLTGCTGMDSLEAMRGYVAGIMQ